MSTLTLIDDGPDSEACNALRRRFRSIGMILLVITAANYAGHPTLTPRLGAGPRRIRDIFNRTQQAATLVLNAVATLLVRNIEVVAVTTLISAPDIRQYGILYSESSPGQSEDKGRETGEQDGEMDEGAGDDCDDIPKHPDDFDLEDVKGFSAAIGTGFATFTNASPRDEYFQDDHFAKMKIREVEGGISHWPKIRDLNPDAIFEKIKINPRHDPLENHIATLTEFMNCYRKADPKHHSKLFWQFSAYIVLASWEKMHRRIMNWTSKGFILRLTFIFPFDIRAEVRKSGPSVPSPEDSPYKSLHIVISLLTKSTDGPTSVKSIMSQLQYTGNEILLRQGKLGLPELRAALEVANNSGYDPTVPVYNENTCVEFHCLLVALFWGYGRALTSLYKATKAQRQVEHDLQHLQGKKQKKEAKAKAGAEAEAEREAANYKAEVWTYARLLWRVTSSQMFKDHLEILGRMKTFTSPEASNASFYLAEVNFDMAAPDPCLDVGPEEEDVEEEMRTGTTTLSADSTTVNPPTPIPASELFKNWTYLNTSHFAALRLLVVAVNNNPNQAVQTSVIVSNHRGGHKYPAMDWHDIIYSLCEHPSGEAQLPANSTPSSNPVAETCGCLQPPPSEDSRPPATTTAPSNPDAEAYGRLQATSKLFSPEDAKKAIHLLQTFIDKGNDKELKILSSFGRNKSESLVQSNDFGRMVPSAQSDDGNQKPLAQCADEKKLHVGQVVWIGNPHCESLAAALLRYLSSAVLDVNDPLHLLFSSSSNTVELAVSKLCCPICWELLQVLRGITSDFMVRGYHTSFYPVELPSWLPEHVLRDMVSRFEGHLRHELVVFLQSYSGEHQPART